MPKNHNSKAFEIALAGISCAVATLFLDLGILSGWLLATGYFIGVLSMMVPLSKGYIKGGLGAYAATCVLTLIMGAAAKYWDIVPFIIFFGIHPLVNELIKKKNFNRWLALVIKALWFDGALIVGYYLIFHGTFGISFLPQNVNEIITRYIYLFIFTLGTLVGVIYDFLAQRCQLAINAVAARIKK